MVDYAQEFELLAQAYEQSGGNPQDLQTQQQGLLVVSGNHILGKQDLPGLSIEGGSLPDGAHATIIVKAHAHLAQPVHLCFGVLPVEGVQRIVADFILEEDARATFVAHCMFPNAVKVQHIMTGTVKIGPQAWMEYRETHYHGELGGVEVLPTITADIGRDGVYISTFKLIDGAAGKVRLDYDATVQDRGVVEMYAKIYGKHADDITVRESICLNGSKARGLAKSRIVLSESAQAEVLGEVIGNGSYSRGHVDCMEIMQGKQARASAVPRLQVTNDTAKLTHEAAIGSVDKRQVETLMARGLSEEAAIDVIVKGILK